MKESFQSSNATSITSKLPSWFVMLNIFSLVLHSVHQFPWYYSQGSSLREEAFFFGFCKFFYARREGKAGWFASTDIPKLPSQASFVFPLLSQGKRKCEWLERQNEPLKEAEGNSELVTHSCLLLASRKMPLKTERRNHFAESKGIDFPATFSRSFY